MVRTDLALEVRESFPEDNVEIKGVILDETMDEAHNIKITTVDIRDEKGAKAMGKPIGVYITIEAPEIRESDIENNTSVSDAVLKYIKRLAGGVENKSILIAGLGNREVTSDSLGPKVIDRLFTTRHLIREYGHAFKEKYELEDMCAIAPGVMAQTGMESGEIIKGIIEQTNPDLLIVIDALAARAVQRLNTTIQITNTGISPGAGIGNNRKALNKESLGIDVIAIGVPTVVDATTIVMDRMEEVLNGQGFSEKEVYHFLQEINQSSMKNMFVTPKNIDEEINKISDILSRTLNECFSFI